MEVQLGQLGTKLKSCPREWFLVTLNNQKEMERKSVKLWLWDDKALPSAHPNDSMDNEEPAEQEASEKKGEATQKDRSAKKSVASASKNNVE